MPMPSLFRHLGMAQMGATSTYCMSIPYEAWAPTLAMTVQPRVSARLRDMTTTAAAPSLIIEALPAVPKPPFLKAGFMAARAS